MTTPPRQELTTMQAAVEAVRRGASYGAAACEHGVSESGVVCLAWRCRP